MTPIVARQAGTVSRWSDSSSAHRLGATESRTAFHERVLDAVRTFLQDHAMAGKTGAREFNEFEKALHERMLEAEREVLADVMSASDVDVDAIEIEGKVHRRVLRSKQTYMTAAGCCRARRMRASGDVPIRLFEGRGVS